VVPEAIPSSNAYLLFSALLFANVFLYMIFGLVEYRKYPEAWWAYLVVTPLAVLLHSLGALWGVVQPVNDFAVTEKTTTADTAVLTERNPELSEEEFEFDCDIADDG
jgi:hypothetical protein